MLGRASRWPGDDHPLPHHHGGTAQAALRAIKNARIAETTRRFQMGREAAQKRRAKAIIAQDSAPKPRKDRVRATAFLASRAGGGPRARDTLKRPIVLANHTSMNGDRPCRVDGRRWDFLPGLL